MPNASHNKIPYWSVDTSGDKWEWNFWFVFKSIVQNDEENKVMFEEVL